MGSLFCCRMYNYKRVSRYSKRAPGGDLFGLDKLFFPICDCGHWFLIVVFVQERVAKCYDSLGQNWRKPMKEIFAYLKCEHRRKKGQELGSAQWELRHVAEEAPQQGNGEHGQWQSLSF